MENNEQLQIAPTASINDVIRLGKVFYESGMFTDIKSLAQAIVKVQAGAELGIPPFQAMTGVHIISGKPCIGAGLMASKVDQHPAYDYAVLQQTDKVCEIQFTKNGKLRGTSTFTIEDARKAGTKNLDKYAANMLFARAMSNGVKFYCPGVFAGPVYTPEEMGETVTEDVKHEVIPPAPAIVDNGNEVLAVDTETGEAGAVQYATPKQKEEIINLLNNPVITNQEKTKMLLNINKITEENAAQAIIKIQKTIKDREAINANL